MAADDLARILLNLQQAISRTGEILYGEKSSSGQGRKKAEIEQLCRLVFVGWKAGSAIPVLELEAPKGQLSMFGHIGEHSASTVIQAISDLQPGVSYLPEGVDRGVMEALDKLGKKIGRGLDAIEMTFTSVSEDAPRVHATFDEPKRRIVESWLESPERETYREIVGRLDDLLGHNRRVGNLFEADGTKWECHFSEDQVPELGSAWLGLVKLYGRAVEQDDRRTLVVEGPIVAVEAPVDARNRNAPTIGLLEDKARTQGFEPINDVEEWLKSFPPIVLEEGESDLHEAILELRAEERKREREAS